jgi:hypothetical protein
MNSAQDRFNLLSLLIPLIPATAMHVIPSLIPEAVLGTKEPSEKSRSAAFDLIVAMGRKMSHGGVVKRDLVDDMMEGVEAEGMQPRSCISTFVVTNNMNPNASHCQRGGVHDDDRWWTCGCLAAYDQCYGNSNISPRLRVQRWV